MSESDFMGGQRQRGGGRGTGRIHKGAPRELRAKASNSIPTKYETLLNPNPKEKDGFMSSTQRFSFDENPYQPGPGAYYRESTLLKDNGSVSKKGFGSGFISKHQRFMYQPQYTGPGPGEYNSHQRTADPKLRFNYSQTSSAFAPAKSDGLGPPLPKKAQRAVSVPGPGAYLPAAKRDGSQVYLGTGSGSTSAFKAQSHQKYKKFQQKHAESTPGPGDHQRHTTWGAQETPSTAFRHSTNRVGKDGSIPARAPPAMTYGAAVDPLSGRVPGPGAYDTHVIGSVEASMKKTANAAGRLESAAFASVELDRFGRTTAPKVTRPQVPGPGAYNGTNKSLIGPKSYGSHLETPNSAFNSNTARGLPYEDADFKPPGPAYYSADPASPKRSYHLNTRRHWVGL